MRKHMNNLRESYRHYFALSQSKSFGNIVMMLLFCSKHLSLDFMNIENILIFFKLNLSGVKLASLNYGTCLFSSAVLAGPLITVPDEEKREP